MESPSDMPNTRPPPPLTNDLLERIFDFEEQMSEQFQEHGCSVLALTALTEDVQVGSREEGATQHDGMLAPHRTQHKRSG